MFRKGKKYSRREKRKIIKILTAIGDNNLNNKLKQENEIEILGDDIFYKEGILEFLEKNKMVDILILYEKLYGEINLINLIKKIKIINKEIIIILILENKNEEKEKILKMENIKYYFYLNEINLENFIKKIKKIKKSDSKYLENEIFELKKIIEEKDEELENLKNLMSNFRNKKEIQVEKNRIFENVGIVGNKGVGKTQIIKNLEFFMEENKKIKFFEISLEEITNFNKFDEGIEKYIFVIENNCEIENLKKNINLIKIFLEKYKIKNKNIKIIFNKTNKYSINKKIIKIIFKNFKVIGNIRMSNYSDYLINKKNNYKLENKKLKKEYLKIVKKIE